MKNNEINETWLSDRDRFSYEGIYNNRLKRPSIKINNKWEDVSWEKAITFASEKIQVKIAILPTHRTIP